MSSWEACVIGIGSAALRLLACVRHARRMAADVDEPRPVRAGGVAKRLDASDGGEPSLLEFELVKPPRLRDGDLVACWVGDEVPGSGTIVRGHAVVAPPHLRQSAGCVVGRGQRVAPGMHVRSGYVIMRIAHDVDTPSRAATRRSRDHPRTARQPASDTRGFRA